MIDRECPVCGVVYQADPARLKWGRQTTCSRVCSYRLRAHGLENKTRVVCATCGREFDRAVSHVKGKHGGQFCSRACHYAGRATGVTRRVVTTPYTVTETGRAGQVAGQAKTVATRRARNNYGHTEATRAKLSIATARALSEGKRAVVSQLEHKVAAQLDRLGVPYVRQHAIRDAGGRFAAVVDFYFPALHAVLEVNGTYWHVDPRVYPAPVNATQERCLRLYRRKLDLLTTLGLRVVEVWEQDLERDIAQAVLIAYAQLTGR
jgi:G:T-mismatch repair DNA endonuclease (very short patch repair protein)